MDPYLREVLEQSFFIRTTMVRKSNGQPRTVETTYVWDGADRIVISGYPGPRDWVATMSANPDVTVHTVEGERWFDIPARARVLRQRDERFPHLIAFIEHWAEQPTFPRRRFMILINLIKLNRRMGLPWWGPFYFARKILDRMPCVEITFVGEAVERFGGPPGLSEPQEGRP